MYVALLLLPFVSTQPPRADKQVFPSLEFIGWYTVAPKPAASHIALHEQVRDTIFDIPDTDTRAVYQLLLNATPPCPPAQPRHD